ncbi:hypothetical protein TIFTF001_022484, partial [Ficus carica]
MADIILKPIAELLTETLRSAGVEEIKRLFDARGELSKLESTLSTIRAVLVDAEKRQISSEQVRDWLEKLEAVLYDADDLVDEVNSEGLRRKLMHGNEIRKKVRTFFSSDNQLAFQHYLAGEIRKITERLDAISADKERFHFVTSLPEETKVRVDSQSFVDVENVVGRDQDRRDIVELLLDHESSTEKIKVPVIPIVGMGGLGKTTLAQLVFNDERVQQHFKLKIWVCVSYNFDVKLICQKIINATKRGIIIGDSPMEELREILRERIQGKRCLLVLDDVWNLEGQDWVVLKDLLATVCREGSGIIVTTRHRWVADVMGTMQPYDLGILDPKDSWNLFKKMAFEHGRDPTNPTTEGIAKQILAKCGGVPLAITMIGRMLRFEDPETEWPSFLERDLPNITQQENEILQTLRLSYDYLPSHLKPCFAYCSLYPKGHEIDVQELIRLWIAQGFIKPSTPNQNLEDIGYLYFKDLFRRSFFQEAERDRLKGFITCKMHDVVHDLAIQISGRGYKMLSSGEANLESHVRHISLDFNLNILREVPSQWLQAERLRSFLLPIQSHLEFDESDKITHTPRGLGQLTNLQTLSQLVLSENPCSGKLDELKRLNLKGNLKIKGLKNGLEPKEAKLKDKQHLQFLCLDFMGIGDDASTNKQESVLEGLQPHPNLRELVVASYGGDRFSSWLSSLTNLVKLSLKNCSRCRQLPSLDRCYLLEELVLMDLDALEYIIVNDGDSFVSISSSSTGLSVLPSLQKFTLENLPGFRGWWRSDVAESQEVQVVFPRLSSLTISRCPSLTFMPCYPNVEEMEMGFTSFERKTLMRVPQAQISATTTTDRASSSSAASSSTTLTVSLSFYPLSKLLSLSLDGIVDLHHFPDERMNGLASLKILRFTRCHRLNYLTPYIHYLTSLEELEIADCQQFEGIEWPETPALTSLRILK